MIDDKKEADELIEVLNEHLPMRAFATPELMKAVRQDGTDIRVNTAVKIDSVLYLGDEGGIACAIELLGGKTGVVASLTHLRFDPEHPLADRIQAYQSRRSQRLRQAASPGPGRSGAKLAAKVKRKTARVAPDTKDRENSLAGQFGTACALWKSGEYRRAAVTFLEVLKLHQSDPHFSRYWLASCLFQSGSTDALDKLLGQLDDNSGIWRFAQALQAFRRHGNTEDSERLLVEADHLEPGFVRYLLQDEVVDASREVRFHASAAERAFGCARLFLPAWRGIPGAATWARGILKVTPSVRRDEVPRRFPQGELRSLPLRRETWQVGLLSEPNQPHRDSTPLCLFGVANPDRQEMRVVTVIDQQLTEVVVWNQLIESFLRPLEGAAARPSNLVVCQQEFHDAWKPLLSKIGIRCQYQPSPQPISRLLAAMSEVIEKQELPSSSDIDIREFPQSDAVWQAGFIRSPAWVMNERDGSHRPWSVLVLEKSHSDALLTAHTPGDPAPEMLLEFLVRTMARSGVMAAQRPRVVEVSDSDCYDHLRPRLETVGIACRLVDELSEFNDFCLRLARSFDGSGKCALADGRGVTRAQMESFYEAAAQYFREAPWRRVPGEVPIEIRCDDPALGSRFAIVLGRTGVQLGLCIYDDWEITRASLSGYASADENRALAVCYEEAEIMSAVDLQLIERLGWPIATPEAWPAVMRLQPRRTPRSASAEELVFLDACLRAIPDFLKTKAASQTRQVETGTRSVELHLAWKRHSIERA